MPNIYVTPTNCHHIELQKVDIPPGNYIFYNFDLIAVMLLRFSSLDRE